MIDYIRDIKTQEEIERQVSDDLNAKCAQALYEDAERAWAYYLTSATTQGRNQSRISYYRAIDKLADLLGYFDPIDERFVVLLDMTKERARPLAHQLTTDKVR